MLLGLKRPNILREAGNDEDSGEKQGDSTVSL